MSENMLNKKIGRYELQEIIGEGAMAIVYRAYDPEINRSVACKILKKEFCVDKEYTSRFLRESKAAGALSHSSIVTIHDVGEVDGAPYIMMELIQGMDLGEVLKLRKKLTVKETLHIAINLAKALDYAHAENIVHRDIKPDNIILLSDGESVKVADFGIARLSESDEAQKTQVGSVLGTPRYMSPEQALGKDIDGRSDLFSVGTILYEMLTGRKTFDANNMGTLMMQIAQEQPEALKKIDATIPTGLRQIVNKLLQKAPEKRFQTGDELAKALKHELNALREQQEEQTKHKYIPLRYKWTLSASAIVTFVLLLCMNIMFRVQSSAMTQQAIDSGESLAKFIATETAVPLLSEDWITLESLVNDASGRETFSYLIVTDRNGIIRAATDNALLGQAYEENLNAETMKHSDDVHTTSSQSEDGSGMFNIATSVLFQNIEVGQIILGISQASLDRVKSITGWLMILLGLITVSSVSLVMFIFAGLIAKPLKAVSYGMAKLEQGDFDARISLERNDEMGKLFDAFNSMAASIQTRYTKVSDELALSGISIAKDDSEPRETAPASADTPAADEQNHTPVDEYTVLAISQMSQQLIEEQDDGTVMLSSQISSEMQTTEDDELISTEAEAETASQVETATELSGENPEALPEAEAGSGESNADTETELTTESDPQTVEAQSGDTQLEADTPEQSLPLEEACSDTEADQQPSTAKA